MVEQAFHCHTAASDCQIRQPSSSLSCDISTLAAMKTCLVLGAGATLANALYFRPARQRDTRPSLDTTFFQVVRARNASLGRDLERYFRSVIGLDPTAERLADLRMEEVFKDVFYDFQDDPRSDVNHGAYVDLVDLYLTVLRDTTNWLCADGRKGAPVGRLMAAAAAHSESLSVVTFNHDLVIENEIARRSQLASRWCLDQGYGAIGAAMTLSVPTGRQPMFNFHEEGQCDHSRPIKIFKLHGSLNWFVRISGTRPRQICSAVAPLRLGFDLFSARNIASRLTWVRTGAGRTSWNTWPMVVPPVYAKQALRHSVEDAWRDARVALEEADRITFFGYSLPQIDVERREVV